jgi:outer membrane protein assembly factor BamB
MTWSQRRAALVLTATAVLGTAAFVHTAYADRLVVAQQIVVAPGGGPIMIGPGGVPIGPGSPSAGAEVTSFDLNKDNVLRGSLEYVDDQIRVKQWEKAALQLQKLVSIHPDRFAVVKRKGANGQEYEVPTGVVLEANRLLATLPEPGIQAYRDLYSTDSERYLKEAKESTGVEDRLAKLGLVARNYLNTDAGAQAADLLGAYYLDRGEFTAASTWYGRLMNRNGGMDKMPPTALFRAAYAFRQSNDKANEEQVWKAFNARSIREVRLGDDSKSIDELQDYLAALSPNVSDYVAHNWPNFLGGANRTNKGEGGAPFLVREGAQPTDVLDDPARRDKIAQFLSDAEKKNNSVGQVILPPSFPVAAQAVKSTGEKVQLAVFPTASGLFAADVQHGNLRLKGRVSLQGRLDWMLQQSNGEHTLGQWKQNYVDQNQRPSIFFENSTINTISTDGTFVYAIEDLAVPLPAIYRNQGGVMPPGVPGNPWGFSEEIMKANGHSQLKAFELASGLKLAWQLGDEKSELNDCYFLGAPVSVNGKLYVLVDKQGELLLATLETVKETVNGRPNYKAKVLSTLSLGTARDSKLQSDVLRRVHAAHLAYGDGVLVCPTNLGYIIGIDLLQNSLLWAYPYREKPEDSELIGGPGGPGFPGKGGRGFPNPGMVNPGSPPPIGWQACAPIIQDGKVVFTAPDSKSLHCINLKDGSPVWSKARDNDDLYLGGVVDGKVVVVGKKVTRAYTLAGKGGQPLEAWQALATGLPSGVGAASDNVYYLPVRDSVQTHEPGIVAIDVDKGVLAGFCKSRDKDAAGKPVVPGNLVFFEGTVLSQSNTEIVAYPQLKAKVDEMTKLLEVNPNDPKGRFDRGELRLEEGNLEGAVQDLLQVTKNEAPKEHPDLPEKAKKKLYETLTDYFKNDFNAAEKYQADYDALCRIDPASKDQAEARRRRAHYLCLVAEGKKGQRKLVEAFEKYQEMTTLAAADELMALPDDPQVKAVPDVLAQGRIAALVAGATEAERQPLEQRMAQEWQELQGKSDLAEWRRFVAAYGSLFAAGQEARLRLAERLMDDRDAKTPQEAERNLLDAERNLNLLRARADQPELAARAVEALARLSTDKGLLEDGAYYYRLLRDRYPKVVVRDGKTGAEICNEKSESDKRLVPYLDEPARFGAGGSLKAAEERDNLKPLSMQTFKFSHAGEGLPFFGRYKLTLRFDKNELTLTDRATGEVRWNKPIDKTQFQMMLTQFVPQPNPINGMPVGPGGQPIKPMQQPPPSPKFAYSSLGHLIVLPVGHMVYGFDALTGDQLWAKNLYNTTGGAAPDAGFQSLTADPQDGSLLAVYNGGWAQRLGQAVPLEGTAVCVQMKDGLAAIDPVSGRLLWVRSDVGPRSHIFGDDRHVFVVKVDEGNSTSGSMVLRAHDGVAVQGAPDFSGLYKDRIRLVGRNLLVAADEKDGKTLRLYDPLTGKDVWRQTYPAKSIVLQAEDCDLGGVVEPDGQVRVVDLNTRKDVLPDGWLGSCKMDPKYLDKEKVTAIHLLYDGKVVYLACDGPPPAQTVVLTNLMPGTGLRALNVNGAFYAFRVDTGKKLFNAELPNTQLVLDQFQDMPMLLFTAQTIKMQGPWGGVQPNGQTTSLQVFEKRTGKVLYPKDDGNYAGGSFHALELDGRNGRIEFLGERAKLAVTLGPEKPKAEAPAPPPATPGTP